MRSSFICKLKRGEYIYEILNIKLLLLFLFVNNNNTKKEENYRIKVNQLTI